MKYTITLDYIEGTNEYNYLMRMCETNRITPEEFFSGSACQRMIRDYIATHRCQDALIFRQDRSPEYFRRADYHPEESSKHARSGG